jgi:hypothetical protein
MVFCPPNNCISNPIPMVFWLPYPRYIEPPTHGISMPLPMVFGPPSDDILTPYPWYVIPLPMVYRSPYPWHFDPLPMVSWPPYPLYFHPLYQCYIDPYPWYFDPSTHGILIPLTMAYRPPTHGISTHLPMVFWPPTHGISTPLSMVYWPPYPWHIEPPSYLLIRNEGSQYTMRFNLPYRGSVFNKGSLYHGWKLTLGSIYHGGQHTIWHGIYHVYHVLLFSYSRIDLFFSILDVINVKQSIYLRYNSSSHTLHTSTELFFSNLVYRKKCHACHLINKRYRIPEGQ